MKNYFSTPLACLNKLQSGRKQIYVRCNAHLILFVFVSLFGFHTTKAQEFGYNDFPGSYSGINITMVTNGSIYNDAYQGMCNVNGGTKAYSIGLSSANLYITFTFSSAVNNITIKIGAINFGHKSVYTTNAGTVSISKIAGDSQCGAIISGNVLTYSYLESYVDDRILVSSTSAFTSLTVTQPADNTDFAIYSLYMGEVSPPAPANPTSVTASSNPICNGTSTLLTANGVDGTVYWYTGSCGGTATSPATGNTLEVSPTVTTTYYARNHNNGQFSTNCASITITVAAQPTAPSLSKNPNAADVCAGQLLTVSATSGTGGAGTVTDQYSYSTNNGSSWSAWSTSIPSFNAVVGTNLIRSRRTAAASGCNESSYNQVSWTINPLLQYRTVQSGNWTTLANWEQYNGSSWVAATSYPGQISSNACLNPLVTIQTGHQMEIPTGSSINIPNLKIEGTGKLTIKSGGRIFVQDQLQLNQNAGGAIVVE
jgi:hypothetical protein